MHRTTRKSIVIALAAFAGLAAAVPFAFAGGAPAEAGEDARCKRLGPQFFYVEKAGACVKYEASLFAFTGMDFAQNDIELNGDRINLPLTGKQLPLLTYGKEDVSEDTEYPKLGGGISNDVTVVRETKSGPLVAFASLGLFTDGDVSGQEDLVDDQNLYNDGSINLYPGVIQQAWIRYQGVQLGIQPSKFDFISAGYSAFPGYASRDRSFAVAATKNLGDVSLSFSLEDSARRNRDDGVIANYDEDFMLDPVLQFRGRHKNGLYHASAAIHRVTFDGEDFGMDNEGSWGLAGRVGLMYEFRSKGDPKVSGDEELSRVMATVSAARGALGYLGIPNLAIDYTVDGEGDMELSDGVSGLVSYMHMLDEKTKLSFTASAFWAGMIVDETVLVELDDYDFGIDQQVEVRGAKLQAGIERRLRPNLIVGSEAAYTWTEARGEYDGYDADVVTVNFPEVRAYLSWKLK